MTRFRDFVAAMPVTRLFPCAPRDFSELETRDNRPASSAVPSLTTALVDAKGFQRRGLPEVRL
jgi:hypothetical protein